VVDETEAEARGDLRLAFLDSRIGELLDSSAILADDVVVVLALVQLENRRAALEVVAGHETSRLELREHAIDRGQADVLVRLDQPTIDVLGAHVPGRITGQDLEDLQARHRDLEAGATQL